MNGNINDVDEIFAWKDQYCVNVEEIDNAHMRLFSIVRRLLKNLYLGDYEKNKKTCIEAVKYLKQYTVQHFAQEEAFQKKIGYGGYEIHKRIHDSMRDVTIPALEKQMTEMDFSEKSVEHFAGVCAAWLTAHIMLEDQAIVGKVKSQWDAEINSDALSILRKHAENFVRGIFQFDIEAENLNYDAYDLGDTIHYYTIYKGAGNDIYRAVVLLDRNLVCHSLGRLIGKELKSLNEIAMSMMEELARTFVVNFIEKYTGDSVVLLSDGIVDKEAFKADFKKLHPDISILWNTQFGHFAFCIKTVKIKTAD